MRSPTTAWVIAALGIILAVSTLVIDQVNESGMYFRDAFLAVGTLVIGARVASHDPDHRYGWLLLAAGNSAALSAVSGLASGGPRVIEWINLSIGFPSYALMAIIVLLFPDGALPSRRWRIPLVILGTGLVLGTVGIATVAWQQPELLEPDEGLLEFDSSFSWSHVAAQIGLIALMITSVLGPIAIGLRIRRADPAKRGPLIWGAFSAALVFVGLILESMSADVPFVSVFVALVFPATTILVIARYGLYDIDRIIHRSMVYGALVLAVGGVYVTTLLMIRTVVPTVRAPHTAGQATEAAYAASAVAAVAATLVVLPLRAWLYEFIERRFYGDTERPYELLTDLARGVGTALTPTEILSAVVDGIAEGLRVPYVAVVLAPREHPERSAGNRRPWPVTSLDLVHRGTTIGSLLVQQRAPDEPWTRRERELLGALAIQAAAPAAAVGLIRDLQQARERLVTAREEEKRRLRKDLHDGVGPVLSGVRMQLRALAGATPPEAVLSGIEEDLTLASSELRRALDGLRPPALDRGLLSALRGVVDRHAQHSGIRITLVVPDELNAPAAAEVALYRILDEALTNCVRHAEANHIEVSVHRSTEQVRLVVADDGKGFTGVRDGGIGTESMRQRCEELGGSFTIEANGLSGTTVTAIFPAGADGGRL